MLVLLIPIQVFAMTDEALKAVIGQADARRDAMLQSMVESPYPPEGCWRREDFALAAYYLNRRGEDANKAILTEREKEFPDSLKKGNFHWHAYLLERIWFFFNSKSRFFPGRMSAEAEDALVDMLWQWAGPRCRLEMTLPERDGWVWGSENHHAQAWSSFWGAAHVFAQRPDCKDRRYADGSTPAQMAQAFDEYFKRYARERAATGLLVECNSGYNKYTLGGWYNMADFADDPVLRERMRMLLDLYWADWAIEQIAGVRGGSRHRCYPGRNSTEGSSMDGLTWYHFGLGTEMSKHPSHMCGATSFYRPPLVVADLALDVKGRGVYEYLSRRPGLAATHAPGQAPPNFVTDPEHPFHVPQGVYALNLEGGALARYTYCTPDFVMGTSMVEARPKEDWTAISSQNRWEGVIFAGHPTARIFVQSLRPARGSVYNSNWSVQKKGVLIVQRLRTSNAKGQRVWFDGAIKRVEREGWVFGESVFAPKAFAAVRVVAGGTAWEPDTVEQHHEEKGGPAAGMWLKCVDAFSPIIIEVARKGDVQDFASFQSAILSNPLKWERNKLDYTSNLYKTSLTLFADYSCPPLVDGKPVDYRAKKVFDCPFIQSDFGSGIVTIQKDERKLVLDFNKP